MVGQVVAEKPEEKGKSLFQAVERRKLTGHDRQFIPDYSLRWNTRLGYVLD
jgi:hypothetical protein